MDSGRPPREGRIVAALARLRARGAFTIPEVIRRATGAKPGDSLLVRATGPGTFEVVVLPHITADDFFAAMALREDITPEEFDAAVAEGIAQRLLPGRSEALAEVAATADAEGERR